MINALNCDSIYYILYIFNKSGFSILPVRLLYLFICQWGGTGSVYLGYVCMSMKILILIGYKAGLYDIMSNEYIIIYNSCFIGNQKRRRNYEWKQRVQE